MPSDLIEITRPVIVCLCEYGRIRVPLNLARKLSWPQYFFGPFKIIERIGPIAYRLEMPPHLGKMNDVFHIFVLRNYLSDPTHVLKMDDS